MYFPNDITFQYFFFDTYIGYFLQALPIALAVSAIYGFIRFRTNKETPISRKMFSCVFVCYITGLVCLVVGLDLMNIVWYNLFYHMDAGREVSWFGGTIDLVPDFFNNISGETIGNFLMFLPFGVLYPLAKTTASFKNVAKSGIICVGAIELLQPVFGRAFDINDVILNTLGILVSATIFFVLKRFVVKDKAQS